MSDRKRLPSSVVANNVTYQVKSKIGSGSFGEIFLGLNESNNESVAIKVEKANTKYPQLYDEFKMYKSIPSHQGVPNIYWFGQVGNFNIMIMEILGASLEKLFNKCHRKFTLKTVLMLGIQLLHRIEHHHEHHHLHRDIKPDNFLMGLRHNSHVLYLIDLGLSKRYRDPTSQEHIPYSENKKLIGTPRYASINSHLGIEQCRRDDLESIGYMLMYFNRGSLPWQGLKAKTKSDKYARILQTKATVTIDQLCEGFPSVFVEYLKYCRELRFTQRPDYKALRHLFYDEFKKQNFKDDCVYDWMDKHRGSSRANNESRNNNHSNNPSNPSNPNHRLSVNVHPPTTAAASKTATNNENIPNNTHKQASSSSHNNPNNSNNPSSSSRLDVKTTNNPSNNLSRNHSQYKSGSHKTSNNPSNSNKPSRTSSNSNTNSNNNNNNNKASSSTNNPNNPSNSTSNKALTTAVTSSNSNENNPNNHRSNSNNPGKSSNPSSSTRTREHTELIKAYEELEADRNNWKRKAEEYEKYALRVKREYTLLVKHNETYPPSVPYSRKRKTTTTSITAAPSPSHSTHHNTTTNKHKTPKQGSRDRERDRERYGGHHQSSSNHNTPIPHSSHYSGNINNNDSSQVVTSSSRQTRRRTGNHHNAYISPSHSNTPTIPPTSRTHGGSGQVSDTHGGENTERGTGATERMLLVTDRSGVTMTDRERERSKNRRDRSHRHRSRQENTTSSTTNSSLSHQMSLNLVNARHHLGSHVSSDQTNRSSNNLSIGLGLAVTGQAAGHGNHSNHSNTHSGSRPILPLIQFPGTNHDE